MIKAIHFTANGYYEDPTSYQDSIRTVIKNSCQAIVLPVQWSAIQPTKISKYDEQWLSALDRKVNFAIEDGLEVLLGTGDFPSWLAPKGYAPPMQEWLKWQQHICERYAGRVRWILPLNECNFGFRHEGSKLEAIVADMMHSVALVASQITDAPGLLLPATLDLGSASHPLRYREWWRFTDKVLSHLPPKWHHGHNHGWAHHAYADIADDLPHGVLQPRVAGVLDLLKHHNQQQLIYLTEQAYVFKVNAVGAAIDLWELTPPIEEQFTKQLANLKKFWDWCETDGRVELFAHYEYQFTNTGSGPWMSGLIDYTGTITPLGKLWLASKKSLGV